MIYLPLPFEKTVRTLEEVGSSISNVSLPPPELYIIVNGKPSKLKVMWRSLVDINAAIQKLKEVNWLYKAVDEDEVEKKVIVVVDSTTSSMLVKATRDDIQYYTIREAFYQLRHRAIQANECYRKAIRQSPGTLTSWYFTPAVDLVSIMTEPCK